MSLTDDETLSILFRCDTLRQTYAQVALTLGVTRSAVSGVVKRLRDARPQVEAARLTDTEVRLILDRLFCGPGGASAKARDFQAAAIAKDFADKGKALTRFSVLYLAWWVMNDLCAAGEDLALKPDNRDVIDWPSWWRRAQAGEVAA